MGGGATGLQDDGCGRQGRLRPPFREAQEREEGVRPSTGTVRQTTTPCSRLSKEVIRVHENHPRAGLPRSHASRRNTPERGGDVIIVLLRNPNAPNNKLYKGKGL